MPSRIITLVLSAIPVAFAAGPSPAGTLWAELAAKREGLPGVRQEFQVSQTYRNARGGVQATKFTVILNWAGKQWRELSMSGSGKRILVFDGQDRFSMEEGGDEFVRTKRNSKDGEPAPSPYGSFEPEWAKAIEVERRPCAVTGFSGECVVLEAPLKKWQRRTGSGDVSRLRDGKTRVLLDTATGMLITRTSVQVVEDGRSGYQSETLHALTRFSRGVAVDPDLFKAPAGMKEVKELSRWDASKLRKQLAGKPAPELNAASIDGKPLSLAEFKGKTVLLDFWTTWCPPCRADAPALDKLYKRYEKELMIVGISVSEDRAIVEKFLKEHPHSFPTVLTTENEMPRPYQIGAFPTYIGIDAEGKLTAAVQGDQGFGELRRLLKKSGMDVD